MNLAAFTIKNPVISTVFVLIALFGGLVGYNGLPRFEDPEFTIRVAKIITEYPGASPQEVLDEITDTLETSLQELAEVDEITSLSKPGLSEIEVEVKFENSVTDQQLTAAYTKIRNKVRDASASLPSGASQPFVNDEFGDVYGLYYAITGPGFTPFELRKYAEDLRQELLLVPGVAKIVLQGDLEDRIFVEISRERALALGISIDEITGTLQQQNIESASGQIVVGDQRLSIDLGGDIASVEELKNLVVGGPSASTQLRYVADVYRGYEDPPGLLLRHNGEFAIGLGVANVDGSNVVRIGEAIEVKLQQIGRRTPAGVTVHEFYHQGKVVEAAIGGFVESVGQALIIVVATLFFFMGLRSGLIMGATVLLTMAATLLLMYVSGIAMHRISLGALIISLGMLVDNGVVITDAMEVAIRGGKDRLTAAIEATQANMKPLIGGTLVGIIAFAPVGFAPGSSAEYVGSLFWVVMIALSFSWFLAFTFTPWLCYFFIKSPADGKAASEETYDKGFYAVYRGFIRTAIDFRILTLAVAGVVLVSGFILFSKARSGFFPASTTPQILVDYYLPEGAKIEHTSQELRELATYVSELEGVDTIQTIVGGNTLRYMLIYSLNSNNAAYGQLIIRTKGYEYNDGLIREIQNHLETETPVASGRAYKFTQGPGGASKIEAEFSGPDAATLRTLAEEAKAVLRSDQDVILVRDDWRRQTPGVEAIYSEYRGQRVGVSRQDAADALQQNFSGLQIGALRDGDDLIPIVARAPDSERADADRLPLVLATSGETGAVVPIAQVATTGRFIWRDNILRRTDRVLTLKAQAEPAPGVFTDDVFQRVRPQIEAIPLPPGYELEWGGEYGDSVEAQGDLATTFPVAFLAMILVVIIVFNSVRQPIIVWCVVPLLVFGVAAGLLITGTTMEFMGILGLLSLVGLVIQNSLVLVDNTDALIAAGKPRYDALVESAASRLRPVVMGAATTVLGVIPLFFDIFFRSMTVVIMFGLSFATLITLFVTPTLYAVLFGIKRSESVAT
ncbi:MAG: efflux RND transporter permease subunit [Pseudomonadota bacterium]